MLIRKVFGGFNLFCFPDVDSRPGKRGLQKKKKKATCSKKRHSAGETAAFQTPRSEATVGLNEDWLQQAVSAKEASVPASPVHRGCAHHPAKDHCHFIGTGPRCPRSQW